MEGSKEKNGANEVVLNIGSSAVEEDDSKTGEGSFSFPRNTSSGSYRDGNLTVQVSKREDFADITETAKPSPNTIKPPKIPTETVMRKRTLPRSAYSKSKSRLLEPTYTVESESEVVHDEKSSSEIPSSLTKSPAKNSPSTASPNNNNKSFSTTPKSTPITPKTPLIEPLGPNVEDDEEVYKTQVIEEEKKSGKRLKFRMLVEWLSFVFIMGVLIASLTVHKLQHFTIWSLELWKYCIVVLVTFCGRLFSEWLINILVFLIEKNYALKKKVLYFVFGVKRSVQFFIWLTLILLAWGLLISRGVKRSHATAKALNYVSKVLASFLIGAGLWMVKTILVKLVASNFHVIRFFDRIQESIFHQYVLQTLSGPPLMEMSERVGSEKSSGRLSLKKAQGQGKEKEEVIDIEKLHKIKQEKVSAWTMKGLIAVIRTTGLTTISDTLEDSNNDDGDEQNKQITSEVEAKAAAYRIFQNVAKAARYIEEEDLLRFFTKDEVQNVLPLFEAAVETGKIEKSAFRNWVVNVYVERKALAHSLKDTKTSIEELNRLLSVIVILITIIVALIVLGLLTTQVLVLISSQLLLVVFMFGNSAKTAFEAIIFVFVMHPFDVGDRCVIDGVQMVVEEMNILTTVFLRYDNEKIFYPNSVLATKPISNFYRSPEMSDSVEFAIDVSTSMETIAALKSKIKMYLESKPQHWRPGHGVVVKEIEDLNKMKMALYVNHTINFQNTDRGNRRSDLLLELKIIFEDLGIRYHLLPQEVQISYNGSAAPALPTAVR